MKNKRRIIYSLMMILVIAVLTTVVIATDSDLSKLIGTANTHIGDTYKLSYSGTLENSTAVYCIQKGKHLGEDGTFILDKYVEIDGKNAKVYTDSSSSEEPTEVNSDLNAQVAYILSKEKGYGTKYEQTDEQMALWHITNAWTTELFGNTEYSWERNSEASSNSVNKEAEKYSDEVGNLTSEDIGDESRTINVIDKTDTSNLAVIEDGEYYRVGPFRWEFDGILQDIIVSGNSGEIASSNLRFVKYRGTVATVVNVSDISTGEAFYIDINKSSGVTQLSGLKLKTKEAEKEITKIYKAKVWFFKGSDRQNLIFVDVESKDVEALEGEGTANYNVSFSTYIGLKKVDDRDKTIPLVGVGFTFKATIQTYDYVSSTEHRNKDGELEWTEYNYEWKDHTMYLNSEKKWDLTNENIFYTNNLGEISLKNISYPTKQITNETSEGSSYTSTARLKQDTQVIATEVSNPYYGYTIGNTYSIPIIVNGKEKSKVVTNHQKLVKLSGYVWLDENDGKTTVRNDVLDRNKERGVNDITVYLKDLNGNIIKTTKTNELGIYSEIYGGEYQFVDVDLDELQAGKYHVEFEYCGIKYQSVNPKLNENNGSKAIDTTTRNILDSKFTSVNGTGTQSLYINNVTVNYNQIQNYKSTVRNHLGCNVYAKTNEAGLNLYSQFTPTLEEIRYINLGVFEKAQADYALTQDLYDVKINVNGYSHIYRYLSVRYNQDGSINEDASWNVGVKFQKNNGTYDRAIYSSDAKYEAPNHRDNELKVYVTYKVALKNESSYLGRINNIVDYCDSRYNLIAVGTSIDDRDNITGNIGYSNKIAYNNQYSKYIINTNAILKPGETQYLYVQFEMDRNAVLTVVNNGDLLNNVIEINSYTTFKNNNINTPVSVIDQDSVPGNTIPGVIPTYEDDTDAARSLKLELKNARALTGTVFIDSTGKDSGKVYTGQERKGNGIFDNKDSTLAGVKVTMREVGKDDSSYDGERVVLHTTTDSNGNFEFTEYIPGNYTVTYTWGDKTYKVQYYKGTIYDESRNKNDRHWYKIAVDTRKTDALDSSEIRTKIDDEMEALKYNTLEGEISKAYEGGSDYIKQTSMDSTTPIMSFSVEYETTMTDGNKEQVRFVIKNVDFGIVERPKQQLQLNKRISAFKLTSSKGTVLVEAQVTEDGKLKGIHNYTTYMKPSVASGINVNGFIRAEIDDELIEGSILETTYIIKATNIGELDYISDRYYYYGNKTGAEVVKASVTGLIDYLDGRLAIVEDNRWQEKGLDYLQLVNSKENKNTAYVNTTRAYLTTYLTQPLAPGESKSVDISTSKLLTSTDDNTFDNQAEIVEVTKSEGFNTGSPVKVSWSAEQSYFNASNAEKVIVIPNTGENKNYVLPIVIGFTTLLGLGIGIFAIKKFIVDKK